MLSVPMCDLSMPSWVSCCPVETLVGLLVGLAGSGKHLMRAKSSNEA